MPQEKHGTACMDNTHLLGLVPLWCVELLGCGFFGCEIGAFFVTLWAKT